MFIATAYNQIRLRISFIVHCTLYIVHSKGVAFSEIIHYSLSVALKIGYGQISFIVHCIL